MHSGKGAGLSETFGGAIDSSIGTGVIEKNLNRMTIICASIFILTLILMMFLWPEPDLGTLGDDPNVISSEELEQLLDQEEGGTADDLIAIEDDAAGDDPVQDENDEMLQIEQDLEENPVDQI